MIKLRHNLSIAIVCTFGLPLAWSQTPASPAAGPPTAPGSEERIVTLEEVQEATRTPPEFLPLRIISYPHRTVTGAMEKGLIKVEKNHLRERLRGTRGHLHAIGVEGFFGGLGEQTGFGVGARYTVRP